VAQPLISLGKVAKRLLGDKAYDSAELRLWLRKRGTKCVIPNRSNRKQPFTFSKKAYRGRHRVENAFCRLEDLRRIATRYDRLARNFLASVCLVATIVWWILSVLTLVPTIAESRVMIRQEDEQTDSPGDGDRPDHRGAQGARSAGWLA